MVQKGYYFPFCEGDYFLLLNHKLQVRGGAVWT